MAGADASVSTLGTQELERRAGASTLGTSASSEWKFPGQVKLVNSLPGQYLCWPGPATVENEFTIPDHVLVESLLGSDVFLVVPDPEDFHNRAKDKLLTDEAGEKVWRK